MAKITTITNPLTGQPAQVDQLDHTAQQIDDAIARALPGGYYDKWVSQLVNPNLLDNWYFSNPVDQRQGRVVKPNTTYYSDNTLATAAGTTSAYVTAYRYATGTASGVSYASFKLEDTDTAPTYYAAPENVVRGYTGAGYGPDRWLSEWGTSLIQNGFVKRIANGSYQGLRQYFEPNALLGKTVTFSVLAEWDGIADGDTPYITIYYGDGAYSGSVFFEKGKTLKSITGTFPASMPTSDVRFGVDIVSMAGTTLDVYAVKLELGDTQTLAHQENGNWQLNEIPDYGEQLARCQRYHFEFGPSHALIAYDGYGVNSPVVYFPVQMRTVSAIKVYSKAGTENAITYWNGSAEVDFTDFYLEWNENFVVLRSNGKFTPGGIYTVGKLIAYADL